jgi:XTP/dITP diphosphohydrolase
VTTGGKSRLVVASRNRGKISEYRRMLEQLGFRVVAMDQAGVSEEVELPEDGKTFEANALQKASALQKITGGWTLGDDSGLEVDALGGAPGVYSARYAGLERRGPERDRANCQKLLEELRDVEDEKRTARFVCAIAMTGPGGRMVTSRGTCEGRIIRVPRGENGFGYDPVFMADGYGRTMAELSMDQKNRISHRGRALRALASKLKSPGAW